MRVENDVPLPLIFPIHVARASGPRVLFLIFFPSEEDLWTVISTWAPVDVLAVERSHIIFTRSWFIRVIYPSQPNFFQSRLYLGLTILNPERNPLRLCDGYQLGSDVIVSHR